MRAIRLLCITHVLLICASTLIGQVVTQDLFSVCFIDDKTGWIVGDSGIILKSIDGGVNWTQQVSPKNQNFSCVHFIDSMNGWAVCWGGPIIKTIDGGEQWYAVQSGENYGLKSVFFINENLGWSAGYPEIFLRSEDGGMNWDTLLLNTAGTIYSLSFTDELNGWYVTAGGKIYHTEDGGDNWNQQVSCSGNFLYDVYFIDDSTGWIAANFDYFTGNYKNILYSTDGGEYWECTEVIGMSNPGFHSIDFVNQSSGWAVGEKGNIINSADGGINWTLQNSGVTEWLTSVDFHDEEKGWAVGLNGTILRTIDGGITWNPVIVSVKENVEENQIELYPNPTSHYMNIRFSLFDTRYSLFIYDIFGRTIDEIIIPPGQKESRVNVSGYPEGIYIAVLRNDTGIIAREKFEVIR